MAEVVLPQRPFLGAEMAGDLDERGHTSFEMDSSNRSDPDPNHAFVFPAHPSLSPPSVSESRGSGPPSRGSHRQRPSKLSISAFPAFEFGGPASSPTTNLSPSPTRSPVRLTPPMIHSSSHKRSGSEFVGGAIVGGGPVLVSTSPESKNEEVHLPPSPPKGRSSGRPGHAHRRSGAVSQSDIKMILPSSGEHRAGSAPSTPLDPTFRATRPPGPGRANSQPGRLEEPEHIPKPSPATRSHTDNLQHRSRVGFSDVVEVIPRPLSTISSETSSSMSTIRAGHSVADSLGSIVSGGTSSPPLAISTISLGKPSNVESSAGRSGSREGDYFATAMGEETGEPTKDPSISEPPIRVNSHSATGGSAQHERFTRPPQSGQTDSRYPTIPSNTTAVLPPIDTQQRSYRPLTSQYARPRTSPEPKMGKHRVKSWAGSILHRKERRIPDPNEAADGPSSTKSHASHLDTDFDLEDMTFDNDTTYIIEESPLRASRPLSLQTAFPRARSEGRAPSPNVEVPSPIIDLDIALGSTSPNASMASSDLDIRYHSTKRRLHSSRDPGVHLGPGMNYHRRTESAPEMEPFDRTDCAFQRNNNNGPIGEAIEEEEEDTDQEATRKGQHILGLGVQIVESEAVSEEPIQRRRSGHSPAEDKERELCTATSPLKVNSMDPVEIVDAEDEPRFSVLTKSSDESTITPTLSIDPVSQRPASAPLASALPTPSLTYGTTPETPSAISSAEYTKTSFDTQDIPRTHTANSSITDRLTLDSSKAGYQSAASVDDVPSLTSSASTMFSSHPTRFSSSGNTTSSAERSASLSAAVPARTRPGTASKRSSLASLSRLVGGPYNRSRLNIEESITPDSPEKPDKKKRRRISRMMTFWKSKEKLSAT